MESNKTLKPIKTFVISVNGGVATYNGSDKIVCGNKRYQVEFAFDEEWNDYEDMPKRVKFSVHRNGRNESLVVEFKGNVCNIPPIFNTTLLKVGVYIEDGISTTTDAVIDCLKSTLCGSSKSMLSLDDIKAIAEVLKGENGADGRSAYEIACFYGFEGTEEEWLASLKGEDGKQGYTPQKYVDYFTEADIKAIEETLSEKFALKEDLEQFNQNLELRITDAEDVIYSVREMVEGVEEDLQMINEGGVE